MIWLVFALLSAVVEATRDFVSKRAMKKVDPLVAAWALLGFTFPFLAAMLALTGVPTLGPLFWGAMLGNAVFYVLAISLYMKALEASDLSLTLPMLAFTPVFMLLTGPIILGELPSALGIVGVVTVVAGAYLLKLKDAKKGLLRPFVSLVRDKGARFMLGTALIYSFTAVLLKLAVEQSSRTFALSSGYLVSFALLTAYLALSRKLVFREVLVNWKILLGVGVLTAISEIALTTAYAFTLAVYAIAVKRLSILIGSVYGFELLHEKDMLHRLVGAAVMVVGVALISLG
jgi:drug/metabolite transporter (DMT)-like permease